MLEILDHVGLAAFALSGTITASNRKLDVLGGYIIAFITAIGGGTIRDLLINVDVAWISSISQITVVFVAATIGIFFQGILRKLKTPLMLFDTIGIAVFTIIGVKKGINHNEMYIIALSLGLITATFGGLLRDVLCNETPIIFRAELYAIPCLAGGGLYLIGEIIGFGDSSWLMWISIIFIMIFRGLAIVFSWKSPIIKKY